MKPKKTKKADLESKRSLFLQLGLIISLGVVLFAFKVNDTVTPSGTLISTTTVDPGTDTYVPPSTLETPPPPPPPPLALFDAITIVENNFEIDEAFDFISTEITDATLIDAIPYISREKDSNADSIFRIVEEQPEFPGGDRALLTWLSEKINYPVIASQNEIQGTVFVKFVVDKDGSITNVELVRGVDVSVDTEALRVVKDLPKWKPGRQRGKAVRVAYNLPIVFRLE